MPAQTPTPFTTPTPLPATRTPLSATPTSAPSEALSTAAPPPGPPDTLTEATRAVILAAVDRANAAWATATQSLDPSVLDGAVAGQELSDDTAELGRLRAQGQRRNNVNTAFTVTSVALDAPGQATVRTRETWYGEIYDIASGRLIQRTPSVNYDEMYSVEFQNGSWIVTRNVV